MIGQSTAVQRFEIPQRLLASRKNHRIRLTQGFPGLNPAQLQAGFGFERIEIGEVAQGGQPQHSDLQIGGPAGGFAFQQIEGIFGWKQLVEPGHHPQHRYPGVGFQPLATLIKQLPTAAEAVDQDAFDQRALHRAQQSERPNDLGEDTAALNVGHQQAVGPQVLGQAQVGEVAALQVHFHRASRPLQHQPALGPLLLELHQAGADRLPTGAEPVAVVVLGAGDPHALAPMDHLTGAVSPGFQQHGIHGAAGLKARRPGLHGLGVGHLPAIGIHPGVVAHVLPLEGQRLFPTALEHPAQRRRHQRFAGTAGGAQHHQGSRRGAGHSGQCRRRL